LDESPLNKVKTGKGNGSMRFCKQECLACIEEGDINVQMTKMKMQAVKGQNHENAPDLGWVFALQLALCGLLMTGGFIRK
jgi:hypothetical protein